MPHFNLGNYYLFNNDIVSALKEFSVVKRTSQPFLNSFSWPQDFIKNTKWPYFNVDFKNMFSKILPHGKCWPKISVVTPSFNQGSFLEQCILSVINQNYPNLQYIIVDSLSSDNTSEIIDTYRDSIDILIEEKDKGQSDALNKGFAVADGTILGWLNCDDLLYPGALFRIASEHVCNPSDMYIGHCLTFRGDDFVVYSCPVCKPADFNIHMLSDIFGLWLQGFFFYQPEVYFTREVFDASGGYLDVTKNYVMDYELWLRFAKCGAKTCLLNFPIAMFRHHDDQKTNELDLTILELLEVAESRGEFLENIDNSRNTLHVLKTIKRKQRISVSVYSSQCDVIFSKDTEQDLKEYFANTCFDLMFTSTVDEVDFSPFDLVIFLSHLSNDLHDIEAIRKNGFRGLLAGWFWENNHCLIENNNISRHCDVCIPAHATGSRCLVNQSSILMKPVCLCVTRLTRREMTQFTNDPIFYHGTRSDMLTGNIIQNQSSKQRKDFLCHFIRNYPSQELVLSERYNHESNCLAHSHRYELSDLKRYKASLSTPTNDGLPQTFFEALLFGQIPLVPNNLPDVDLHFSPEIKSSLSIVQFEDWNTSSIMRAHNYALSLFDQGGADDIQKRHRYAMNNSFFVHRIEAILECLFEMCP